MGSRELKSINWELEELSEVQTVINKRMLVVIFREIITNKQYDGIV